MKMDEVITEDTISNWECNRSLPNPEQVAALEKLYESPGLWDAWMRLQWPSYRERIPEKPEVESAAMAVVNAGWEMQDVNALTEILGRDLMDGRIDDPKLAQKYISKARGVIAALSGAIEKLEKGGKTLGSV